MAENKTWDYRVFKIDFVENFGVFTDYPWFEIRGVTYLPTGDISQVDDKAAELSEHDLTGLRKDFDLMEKAFEQPVILWSEYLRVEEPDEEEE